MKKKLMFLITIIVFLGLSFGSYVTTKSEPVFENEIIIEEELVIEDWMMEPFVWNGQ